MIKEGKFGVNEASALFTITISSKVFFSSPSAVVRSVGTAGWYMTLISAFAAIFALVILIKLLKLFPNTNIMEIYEKVLGKFFGKILTLVLFMAILITVSANSREFIEILKVYDLSESPPSYLLILMLTVSSILGCWGLETIARLAKLMAYFLLFAFLSALILSAQLYDINRIFPILGYGLNKTIFTGMQRASAYGEIILIGVIINSLQGIKHVKRTAYLSIILSAAIISAALLAFCLAFPYYVGEELTAPIYSMVSIIEYGEFIQRIEPLYFFIWNISTVISISFMFYTLIIIYAYIFELDDKRPIILPLAIIVLFLSIIPLNIVQLTKVIMEIVRNYGWILYFIPPTIALIVAKIRKLGGISS